MWYVWNTFQSDSNSSLTSMQVLTWSTFHHTHLIWTQLSKPSIRSKPGHSAMKHKPSMPMYALGRFIRQQCQWRLLTLKDGFETLDICDHCIRCGTRPSNIVKEYGLQEMTRWCWILKMVGIVKGMWMSATSHGASCPRHVQPTPCRRAGTSACNLQ